MDDVNINIISLDDTFPELQFHINGFSPPYRRDRNDRGGGGGYYYMYENMSPAGK